MDDTDHTETLAEELDRKEREYEEKGNPLPVLAALMDTFFGMKGNQRS